MPSVELHELRLKSTPWGLLRFISPFCFVGAAGIWARGLTPDHHLTAAGWIMIVPLLALLGSFALPLLRPEILTLTTEGFAWSGGVRKAPKVRWSEVLELGLTPARYFGPDRLGYNYRLGLGPYDPTTQASVRRTLGYDVIVPNSFSISSQELLAAFQRYLDAWQTACADAEPAGSEPWDF